NTKHETPNTPTLLVTGDLHIVNQNFGFAGEAVHAGAADDVGRFVGRFDRPGVGFLFAARPDLAAEIDLAGLVLALQLDRVPRVSFPLERDSLREPKFETR